MPPSDTIAAVATPNGHGGIGVIRLSGPSARTIAESLTGITLQPRYAHYSQFQLDNVLLDSGIALFFAGPNSFTGEDVVELQGHGGPVVLDMLLQACCQLGAQLARPGEFSERAFLNDKIDLAQAEAIADLIDSSTEQGAINANRSLQGEFSQRINVLVSAVTELRVYIEAAIDFPEEEIDFIAEGPVTQKLEAIEHSFEEITQQAHQGSLVREGMKLVIAGKPNAGKSSLLNALSGLDSAIVTPIEGTTRDVLREHIEIDGMPLHIVDTAGLRNSLDAIEKEGVRRAWLEMETADRILLVLDSSDPETKSLDLETADPKNIWPELSKNLSRDIPVTIIHNKCDLTQHKPAQECTADKTELHISAKTGAGMDILREHLKACMGFVDSNEGAFSARRRHLNALDKAKSHLLRGKAQLINSGAGELLAEDLRQCQNSLGEITGIVTSDDLLGEIFSSFCIGK
jgi:tRNA modification GTPase